MSWKIKRNKGPKYPESVDSAFLERAEQAGLAEWFTLEERRKDGFHMMGKDGLSIIVSVSQEDDGENWAHLSMSYRTYLPSYDTMVRMKRVFLGDDLKAVQVFPRQDEYVNIFNVLHLWACLGRDMLPDFTRGGRTI